MNEKKWAILLILIITLLSISNCKSYLKNEIEIQKKTFTYESLKRGKLAIGGVISYVHKGYTKEEMRKNSLTYANELRIELLKRKDLFSDYLSVIRLRKTIQLIGEKTHRKVLEEYRKNKILAPELLKKLRASLKGVRYILFVTLERDKIVSLTLSKNAMKTVTKTFREIQGWFSIYDLKTYELVWRASVARVRANIKEHASFLHLEKESFEVPEPETFTGMIYYLFSKFARGLLKGEFGPDLKGSEI